MFTNLLEIIQEYGFIITILIFAIFVSYLIIKNSTKTIKSQQDKIDSLYNKIDKMIKSNTDEHGELAGRFVSYAENAAKIQIQLYHLLQHFSADRISIFEFHNGGKNLSGVEFKKCSNTYEAVALEITPIIKEMQNLPLSMNPLWNGLLATRQDVNIPDVQNLKDDFFRIYLETQSIKTYYAILLEDYDNTPVGFICMEYYKSTKTLSKTDFNDFNEIAIKISGLINFK